MSNLLSQLLAAEEPLFAMSIKQLENTSGRTGQDVRLISDVVGRAQRTTRTMGLDPSDTTGMELYQALLLKVGDHDQIIVKRIGGQDSGDVKTLAPLVKKALEDSELPRSAWVLKRSVAKRLLKDNPPPTIMKHLKYSSVDSLIKREPLSEIYAAMRFTESPAWLKKFNKAYKDLTPSDFETRNIEIIILDNDRWGDLAENYIKNKHQCLTHLKELGVIALLPTKFDRLPGYALTTLTLGWHYMNEIRLYSAFFKHQQVKPGFGKIIADTLNTDSYPAAIIAGHPLHWRVVHHFYGNTDRSNHPEVFEPHIQAEDLAWRKASELLHEFEPALEFWRDLDYVGVVGGQGPISFNLLDMAMNYYTGAPYEQRHFHHVRGALWNELFSRYLSHRLLENQVLSQLDNDVIKAEKLVI